MSNIEWTDTTWNPVVGCTPISPGCLNCYAATMARRLESMGRPEYVPHVVSTPERQTMPDAFGVRTIPASTRTVRIAEVRNGRAVYTGDVRCLPDRLGDPLGWKRPRMVFVCSMSDLFHESVPDEFIDMVMAVISICRQHTFQVLTKRPDRMAKYFLSPRRRVLQDEPASETTAWHIWAASTPFEDGDRRSQLGWRGYPEPLPGKRHVGPWPLPNLWLGASVENQPAADERVPKLLECYGQAAHLFLSCEPLLGPVELNRDLGGTLWMGGQRGCGGSHFGNGSPGCPRERHHHHDNRCNQNRITWVIAGGESGPASKSRICEVEWLRSLRRQCGWAMVPFFLKQVGTRPMWPVDDALWIAEQSGKLALRDRKGGHPAEWPADLRVREMPEVQR